MLIGWLAIVGAIRGVPWAAIARVFALVVIVLGPVAGAAWFGYQLGFSRGADELLEQATEYETAIRARDEVLESVRRDLDENARRLEAARELYAALEALPPQVVVRYRDARPVPAEVIVSPEADQAVAELLEFVRQLAELEVNP